MNRDGFRCLRCPLCELTDIEHWLRDGHIPDEPLANLPLTAKDSAFLHAAGIEP